MTFMNRMGNAGNRYQTSAKRVLCLCSAGLLRSPTIANVLHQDYGYNTRAAGVTKEYALIFADRVLIEWADQIVCVEQSVHEQLTRLYHDDEVALAKIGKNSVILDIPDTFPWNDARLREAIREKYAEALKED